MNEIVNKAVEDFRSSAFSFAKFIAPNDTDSTGSHQSGYLINKHAWNLFFDKPGIKGELKDIFIVIRWQDQFDTNSRFIYYGKGTRNEYRLTNFGRSFPYRKEENIGDLLLIFKKSEGYYHAWILHNDEDIEEYLWETGFSVTQTNQVLHREEVIAPEDAIGQMILKEVADEILEFPETKVVSQKARDIYMKAWNLSWDHVAKDPDKFLIEWINTEYQLFRAYENKLFKQSGAGNFTEIDQLLEYANTLLNRRKSRAGKALENHLACIFNCCGVSYDAQVITEGNKKPDFIFPKGAYHYPQFDTAKLFFLAAKTTCKDRWRQILNEADKISIKHLVTLQQGISNNQWQEMKEHNVQLVVPAPYKKAFLKRCAKKYCLLPLLLI